MNNSHDKAMAIKKIIRDNTGKFISVDFVKKDGSLRHMICHKSKVLEAAIKGTNPEVTAKRNETLKATDKLCVEEMTSDNKFQFRVINLATVKRIAANGKVIEF